MAKQFEGVVGRTWESRSRGGRRCRRRPTGAPNVVIVLLDDVGYAQFGCYGSDIATPTLRPLAARRAALLELPHDRAVLADACLPADRPQPPRERHGPHRRVRRAASPATTPTIPQENGFLSEILVRNGYATFAVGKWHLTPATEMTMGSPRDKWPLGRGFERFYGFWRGETDQYHPDLVDDNHPIEPPRTPEEGYHLTEDLADRRSCS